VVVLFVVVLYRVGFCFGGSVTGHQLADLTPGRRPAADDGQAANVRGEPVRWLLCVGTSEACLADEENEGQTRKTRDRRSEEPRAWTEPSAGSCSGPWGAAGGGIYEMSLMYGYQRVEVSHIFSAHCWDI
jgi:hypothetical protein